MSNTSTLFRCTKQNLPNNLIGAAVLVTNNRVQHAGIFIRYEGKNNLFHYTGEHVLLEDFNETELYFFKELKFIEPELALSFMAHCQIVMAEAKPLYGYFYVGSMYDSDGKFISPQGLPEYMTCVGFCLNFIKYFLSGQDFFYYLDWTANNLGKKEGFVNIFLAEVKELYPNINIENFTAGIRRIYPLEYITGAFASDLPVRKEFIDIYSPKVHRMLLQPAANA